LNSKAKKIYNFYFDDFKIIKFYERQCIALTKETAAFFALACKQIEKNYSGWCV
jgi:hypothetical protein